MTPGEQVHAISHRDYTVLADIAAAEQARVVAKLDDRAGAERDRGRRASVIAARDERNYAWGEIVLWLRSATVPEYRESAARIASSAAAQARRAWRREGDVHPHAAHWFGLWMIDRMIARSGWAARPGRPI